jgi:hypothetical protein
MRRVQFIELHEQPWFPAFLRDQITDTLQSGMRLLKVYSSIAPFLQALLNETGSRSIVDICSGGGGPWLALSRILSNGVDRPQIWLTDKYPNVGAFESMNAVTGSQVLFCTQPVHANQVPREMEGVRTIFSSFHHFSPTGAVGVLQDAVDARRAIGVFEITRRAPSAVLRMFPWAFLVFCSTPFIRPFRWSRLFWTYIVPLIPLVLLFDGVISCLRTYRPDELQEIIGMLKGVAYEWRIGEYVNQSGDMPITYLIGWPKSCEHSLFNNDPCKSPFLESQEARRG